MQKDKNALIYFAQCDTTAGLLSHNPLALNAAKGRPTSQAILLQVATLEILKTHVRIPNVHKNRIRRAKKCSFIYPNNKAIRVVQESGINKLHLQFFNTHKSFYSTSANLSGAGFNQTWAEQISDVIVYDKRGFAQYSASKIYKINHSKIQRKR